MNLASRGLAAFLFATATITLGGCAPDPSPYRNSAQEAAPPAPDPTISYAEGWNSLLITANFAKTSADTAGHYSTSRNACGKDADGAMDIAAWNRFAKAMNAALAARALTEPRCSALQAVSKFDGTAEAQLPNGKRLLLEVRGMDLCSTVDDAELTRELFEAVSSVVDLADKEECPNGWGSA